MITFTIHHLLVTFSALAGAGFLNHPLYSWDIIMEYQLGRFMGYCSPLLTIIYLLIYCILLFTIIWLTIEQQTLEDSWGSSEISPLTSLDPATLATCTDCTVVADEVR